MSLLDEPAALVALIDVSAMARKLYGDKAEEMLPEFARPMPEHDWRWHVSWRDGALTTGKERLDDGACTFAQGTTAAEVAEYLRRDGLIT